MSTPEREATDRELSRCYADIDRVTAERDALQALLTSADEREDTAIAFVTRLIERAGGQPSVATGYLRDILDALKPAEIVKCKACDGRGSVCIDWEAGAWAECTYCARWQR